MPVFCLTPIEAAASISHWRVSTIRPKCVWVSAENEEAARRQVQVATTQGRHTAGAPSPWTDSRMVTCKRDDSIAVASGVIRVGDGTLVPINPKHEHRSRHLDMAAWGRR